MAHLEQFQIGTLFKFRDGSIGMVIGVNALRGDYVQDGKAIMLVKRSNGRFFGELAEGYFDYFREDHFEVIGRIQTLIGDIYA